MHSPSLLAYLITALAFVVFSSAQVATGVTTWAPIPTGSDGPKPGPDNWRVEAFGGGAYMVTDNQYQALFLVSTAGVVVVDAPPTIGRGLLWAIGNTTNIPITHMVYSHSHADHIGGAYLVAPKNSKVKTVAHRHTREILGDLADPKRPVPQTVFDSDYTLCVGNQTLELSYKGNNHQPGNIFIYAPKQKVLMLVDIVYPGWAPFSGLGQAEYVPGYIRAYDQALEYDFDHLVAGHLTRSGTRADVLIGQRYVADLKANCIQALLLSAAPPNATNPISAGVLLGPIQNANPDNPWAAYKFYLDALAGYCANVTNPKWIGTIAAVDTFGFENAITMVESLRIDFDVLGPFGVK